MHAIVNGTHHLLWGFVPYTGWLEYPTFHANDLYLEVIQNVPPIFKGTSKEFHDAQYTLMKPPFTQYIILNIGGRICRFLKPWINTRFPVLPIGMHLVTLNSEHNAAKEWLAKVPLVVVQPPTWNTPQWVCGKSGTQQYFPIATMELCNNCRVNMARGTMIDQNGCLKHFCHECAIPGKSWFDFFWEERIPS